MITWHSEIAFDCCDGVLAGFGEEVCISVGLGVEIEVDVGVAVAVGVEFGVELRVGVAVGVGVAFGVEVGVGVDLGVEVDVEVGVEVGVWVGLGVGAATATLLPIGATITNRTAMSVGNRFIALLLWGGGNLGNRIQVEKAHRIAAGHLLL